MYIFRLFVFSTALVALSVFNSESTAAGKDNSQFGASYSCGAASPTDASRICTCDKYILGDCKMMADEVCVDEFYTCDVGSTFCKCQEKKGGPSAITIGEKPIAPPNNVVAPSGSLETGREVRRAPALRPMKKP